MYMCLQIVHRYGPIAIQDLPPAARQVRTCVPSHPPLLKFLTPPLRACPPGSLHHHRNGTGLSCSCGSGKGGNTAVDELQELLARPRVQGSTTSTYTLSLYRLSGLRCPLRTFPCCHICGAIDRGRIFLPLFPAALSTRPPRPSTPDTLHDQGHYLPIAPSRLSLAYLSCTFFSLRASGSRLSLSRSASIFARGFAYYASPHSPPRASCSPPARAARSCSRVVKMR
ncbi:hypothetical protein B0H11DRAFT_225732 [Mycena galericulata]|nr:hypothetical protein B0H11DRAFT_225732 [Mycena galericulata]